jgi:hypothetical protein
MDWALPSGKAAGRCQINWTQQCTLLMRLALKPAGSTEELCPDGQDAAMSSPLARCTSLWPHTWVCDHPQACCQVPPRGYTHQGYTHVKSRCPFPSSSPILHHVCSVQVPVLQVSSPPLRAGTHCQGQQSVSCSLKTCSLFPKCHWVHTKLSYHLPQTVTWPGKDNWDHPRALGKASHGEHQPWQLLPWALRLGLSLHPSSTPLTCPVLLAAS